jgi:hypothetical protein
MSVFRRLLKFGARSSSLRWSVEIAPSATAGSDVTIAAGTTVLWDVASTPTLGSITIDGTLIADSTQSVALTASDVMVSSGGLWKIAGPLGTDNYTHTATITLTGAKSASTQTARPNHPSTPVNQGFTNLGMVRALNNHGTRFFKSVTKNLLKTKLNATAAASATSITLLGDCSDWSIGDDIVIAPTNFYGQSVSERRTLTSVGSYSGGNTVVGFTTGLVEKHWGLMQYPIDAAYGVNAMSLTPGTFTAPDTDTPIFYDVRAEVINVSSGNVIVQAGLSSSDSDWSTSGWGVHTMDHFGSSYYDEGVRVIRGGQRGSLGRYPFHAHRQSYADQRAAVTFDRTGATVVVNWTGHGVASTPITGTVTFGRNPFVGPSGTPPLANGLLYGIAHGITASFYGGRPFFVQAGAGSTLPTGITAGTVYYMLDASGDIGAPSTFYISRTPFTGNPGLVTTSMVGWTDSGTGTTNTIDTSVSDQPVYLQTTGTLPNALSVGDVTLSTAQATGTKYYAVGVGLTANTFSIHAGDGVPIASTASAGSGTHSGLWTKFTADQTQNKRIKCVVDTSENRAFTTHATCGTTLQDCIAYDVKGMAFFLEDGSEERNIYTRNFALKVRNPVLQSDTLKDFDKPYARIDGVTTGSSGHWWTNMYNQFTDNYAADCDGVSIFNVPGTLQDLSAAINLAPIRRPVLRWLRNGGHSNAFNGLMTAYGVDDAFGRNTLGPVTNLYGDPTINVLGFPGNLMEGGIAWKNVQGGYQNTLNVQGPSYKGWTTGDNISGDFQGAMNSATNTATSILMIGQSLNDGPLVDTLEYITNSYPPTPRFGNATYHFTLGFTNVAYQNFPWVRGYYKRSGQQDYGGGAVEWRDLYTDAVAPQRKHSINNKFNNSHPGHLTRADRYTGYPITITLANPCVLTPAIVNATTGDREFQMFEGEPIRFVRTTGTLPSHFVKDTAYYAKNVRNGGGTLVGLGVLGVTCELSLTSGGASISTLSDTQTGSHSAWPGWVTPHVYWVRGMGSIMPDADGSYIKSKTGTAPGSYQWVCPYGDNPFHASGATGFTYVDPTQGLDGNSFSTSDFFIGISMVNSNVLGVASSAGGGAGMKLTRVTPTTLAPIGTYAIDQFPPDTTGYFFPYFQTGALLNIRGSQTWYLVEPGYMPDGTAYTMPTTYMTSMLTGAQEAGTNVMLGLSFSGTATLTSVFRSYGHDLTNTIPSVPNPVTGMSVTCTAATGASNAIKLAAVAADSTGSLYWQDTANNRVWIRHIPLPGGAAQTAFLASLLDSNPQKDNDPAWIVIKG